MAVRDARFGDIGDIVGLMRQAYARSHYANSKGDIDERVAKQVLMQSIQRHGHQNGGACFVQVAETAGILTGFIVGTLQRTYVVGNTLTATDLFWYCGPGADAGDAAALMRNMITWAKSCPHVLDIKCGTTDLVTDMDKDAGLILRRLGMKPYGSIHRMEL